MAAEWGSLPLLSLRCVLDHLSTEDALAALSTCRHWRSAILLYEGQKELLKLNVKTLERNLFVTRLFKKYTRRLHVIIDSDNKDLENFMNFVLPQFFDTMNLQELVFIGPVYLQQKNIISASKLNRIITESLMFKNSHCLQRFTLLGCTMAPVKNENDRYTHKYVEYYSRPLTFSAVSPFDTVFSHCNAGLMAFSSLRQLIFDFDLMSTQTLQTLSLMGQITDLTLTIGQKRPVNLPLVDWNYANRNLRVTLIVITVPHCMMNMVIEEVFIEGLPLFSLKVLFCETLHVGILQRVVLMYKETIREFVWIDSPGNTVDVCGRIIKHHREPTEFTMSNVNPIILLCWQCTQLKRLVIHGYWVWQYDLLGIVRLRRSLQDLEISAIYDRQSRFTTATRSDHMVRVLATDTQKVLDPEYIQQVNSYTEFEWVPALWEQLHPALRPRATVAHRIDYVLRESLRPAVRTF
ncbi:uncharacterized protein LOC126777660 [Nymphalis io]|uniref:uncharacterized protein LOC126777660 n=1 Tax=Inachis io TaxID=171585 RepID=UPI0021683E70|nr:uncharacterized protein LOC126777660 [Nymphalis io]